MAFKMSQAFPTASLDITEDFHILQSAYVYICYSILKAKTYNWLPNTHTTHMTSNNYNLNKKQLGTSHLVISLAQKLLSCAKFRSLRVIKKANFADIGLTVGTPAGVAPTKECFKRSRWFGKRHKTDAFTKLGEPTIRAACTPQTVLGRHF